MLHAGTVRTVPAAAIVVSTQLKISTADLYTGGSFTVAGPITANRIVIWDPDANLFSSMGPGFNQEVSTIETWGDSAIFAGRTFTETGIDPVENIARWNGTQWQSLGSGMNGETVGSGVLSISMTDDSKELFAGGIFTRAGGKASYAFAQYSSEPVSVAEEPGRVPEEFNLEQNYPNPFNPTTTIRYALSKDAVVSLKVYNIKGQLAAALLSGVSQSAGEYSITPDANQIKLESGIYFYQLTAGGKSSIRKMLLVK